MAPAIRHAVLNGVLGIRICLVPLVYCAGATAIDAVFEVTPPIVNPIGISGPVSVAAGTCTLIWYRPTKPGASPENATFAGTPPIVTTGVVRVRANGLPGLAAPRPGRFVTSPRPVA